MTAEEIEAIVGGYHGDAFRILGPHAGENGWEVRAWLPQAKSVAVICNDSCVEMKKKHDLGFFIAKLEGEPSPYKLELTLNHGLVGVREDPYRFPPMLTEYEIFLYGEGTNFQSYDTMGAHLMESQGVAGVRFAVWAPNAINVSVAGDFNDWDTRRNPMRRRNGGIWELFMPGVEKAPHTSIMCVPSSSAMSN